MAHVDPSIAHTVWKVGATIGAIVVLGVGLLRRRRLRRAPDRV
jgi:hypothetical protein